MKGLPFVLAFTAMTFVAWGAYGPLLHHGTASMGRDSLRAFVGVGIAYFFIAVLVPITILRKQGESGKWTISGAIYSLIAGAVGAVGALGVILALSYGGMPVYVMPLVFGFAPIVNTLMTAWMSKTFDQISPIFIGGIVVASLGVGGVLAFKPTAPPSAGHPTSDAKSEDLKSQPKAVPKLDKTHSSAARISSVRFVAMWPQQEPTPPAPLPPMVVQPPAPVTDAHPAAVPATTAVKQPIAPDEVALPPVVVQPTAPADAELTTRVPAANPHEPKNDSLPSVDAAAPALPPVVVLPAPLQPALESEPSTTGTAGVSPAPAGTLQPALESAPSATRTAGVSPAPAGTLQPALESAPSANRTAGVSPAPAGTLQPALESAPSATRTAGVSPAPAGTKSEPHSLPLQPTVVDNSITSPTSAVKAAPPANVPMIVLSIVVAAICWGTYGPMLHQGQSRMGGSRLRPFTCVGLAYFFIAVAAPLAAIYFRTADTGNWSVGGLSWSIVAGAAGAIGALGVILAFNAGGKPYYVMPLVFGFAPVINTCISLTESGTWGLAKPLFWISLAVVIAGAITVLINAPKPQHKTPHS